MEKYFIKYNEQIIGPMREEELFAYDPTPETQVMTTSTLQFLPLYNFPHLMRQLSERKRRSTLSYYNIGKDKTIAGLIAIVLGGLGVHYFYLKNHQPDYYAYCSPSYHWDCGRWSHLSRVFSCS